MMSQSFADAEFWLPPGFLTDNDIVMSKDTKDKANSEIGGGFGSMSLFSYEFPSGFSPNVWSPVESVVSSTETESDEEDYLAGLIRTMAHSTLEDDLLNNDPMFPSQYHRACGLSHSPSSTILREGNRCGCWKQPAQNYYSDVSSPAAGWDSAAGREVSGMRMGEESYGYTGVTGRLLGQPTKIPNQNGGYNAGTSPFYQKLQAARFEHLKQQMMLKQRRQQLVQSRGMVDSNCRTRTPSLSHAAWPTLQHAHQQHRERVSPAMRGVFLGNSAGKKESAGTGVFLPRRVNTSPASKG